MIVFSMTAGRRSVNGTHGTARLECELTAGKFRWNKKALDHRDRGLKAYQTFFYFLTVLPVVVLEASVQPQQTGVLLMVKQQVQPLSMQQERQSQQAWIISQHC